MHIGLVIYGSLDTVSGGFLYDRTLVEYLRGQGDRVEVISLPWRSYGRSLGDNLSSALLGRLRRARFDVLLQDELTHPSFFWLNRRLRVSGSYPIIAIVHHLRSREDHPPWRRRLYRWVERRYLASVQGFVFVSRTTRADVEGLLGKPRPGVLAYPGGDRLAGSISPEDITRRALKPGPLEIVAVANLIPRKEVHTLLAALARLPIEEWRLRVAGSLTMDPAYVRGIRGQLADTGLTGRVELLGTVADQDLAALLAKSQVQAVPSSYEGLGIVYLEGMRLGLPAIASTSGAAHEVIAHGRDGFLVPPGDVDALAHCLGLLLRDRERLLTMSLAARERSAGHPTWGETVARVHRFLHQFKDKE